MFSDSDQFWMQTALSLAQQAEACGEVPVGAVLVADQRLIASAHNMPISLHDPTAHAEILTLRAAAQQLKNYRLIDTTLYVTLEPCLMCAGALVHARIKRLVYAASDTKAGAISSQTQVCEYAFLNHRIQHQGGLLATESQQLLKNFFTKKRNKI